METVKRDFPQATDRELAAKSLGALCSAPESRKLVSRICETQDHLAALRALAVVTLGGTLVLLVAVHWAGQRCRRNRKVLLDVFRIGTYGITAATLLVVLSEALLFTTMLYYGPVEFLNRLPTGIILFTGFAAFAAVYRIIRLLFAFNKEISSDVDGRFLSSEQAPELWRFVTATAAAVGTEPPRNIVAGADATFFVTDTRVKTAQGDVTGRTLYLSLPLCHILTKQELRSIIGHEMAHFHGQDTEFSRRFYPIFRRGANTLEAVVGTAQSAGGGGYALLPAISLLSFYLESFSEAEAEISRERELAADAMGAGITSKRDFAVALTKVVQYGSAWERAYAEFLESTTAEKAKLPLPSELFREVAARQYRTADRIEQIEKLEAEQLAHPTDSHPPLRVRLEALGFTVEGLYDAAGEILPAEPSSTMIPDADVLERAMLPDFAPKSSETQAVFCRRQAGFAAMEYYALMLNRSFLVYVCKEGLYGIKFRGLVASNESHYFEPALDLLDDPYFMPGTQAFQEEMKKSSASFFIPGSEIANVEFDGSSKWGMGQIPHAGKLRVRLRSRKTREFILLGDAYGDGIRRVILENRDHNTSDQ